MGLSGHEGEIPIPITSTYVGGNHGHPSMMHESPPTLHPSSNGPTPALSLPTEDHNIVPYNPKKGVVVKYKECLKNHAASIGGNATDGCGEFMPSGEEGTLEALKCSACSCHRNFHRKEVQGDQSSSSCDYYHHLKGSRAAPRGPLISGPEAFGYPRPLSLQHHHHMVMPLGAMQASESDEMEGGGGMVRPPLAKKRFRTKFTPEQKEKMLCFAERVGWRLQRQEESEVQQFCQEIGVKRRVLKVWMHNNKHNLAKKASPPPLQLE